MNKKIYQIISFCLVIAWMVVIFMLSAMNGTESGNESKKVVNKFITVFSHILNIDNTEVTNSNDVTNENNNKRSADIAEKVNTPFRKCMHASVYFILVLLLFNYINTFDIKKYWLKYILSLLIAFIYACLDEYHQTFVVRKRRSV